MFCFIERSHGKGFFSLFFIAAHILMGRQCSVKRVFCKTWTGILANSANSADPDQTPQNAASDQALHSLLKLHEVK